MRTLLGGTLAIALAVFAHGEVFEATAYSDHGQTASGHTTRRGVVAADPHVLPLGTRIRITGAGRYWASTSSATPVRTSTVARSTSSSPTRAPRSGSDGSESVWKCWSGATGARPPDDASRLPG